MPPKRGAQDDVALSDLNEIAAGIILKGKDTKSEEGTELNGDDQLFEWDYVMVFKIGTKKQEEAFRESTAKHVYNIRKAGLKTYLYKSVQADEVYVLIGATERRLRREADRLDYEMPLDETEVKTQGKKKNMRLALASESKEDVDRLVSNARWIQMYGKYDQYNPEYPDRQKLYFRPENKDPRHKDTIFRSTDRLRLIFGILQEDPLLNGAGIKIFSEIRSPNASLAACFPLHVDSERHWLEDHWAKKWWPMFDQPLLQIRNYFGEKVAFYFAYLQYYCIWLLIPSFVGVILFIWQRAEDRVDIPILPFAGIAVAVWATLFLEFWKRRESTLRAEWGMTNFVLKEPPRPEFEGERVRSPVDGSLVKYFPFYRRVVRALFSQTIIWSLILIVVGSVISIFVLRRVLVKWSPSGGAIITSLINAVQIQVLNVIYGIVADKLNNFENHRTQSDWENSLIAKTFLFKFINSYNSLFYIAFFKRFVDVCENDPSEATYDPNCLTELTIQLAIIFGSAIFINNGLELIVPMLKNIHRAYTNRVVEGTGLEKTEKPKSEPEKQFELEVYTTTADYDEMVVQFGYVALFVVAFPLAFFLALFNNYFEIRLDAHKLCNLCQRPSPAGAATIGTWHDILTIVSFIAVAVNMIICIFYVEAIDTWIGADTFTADELAWKPTAVKLGIFIITERVVMLLKFSISYLVDDVPIHIQDHIDRENYVVSILINGVEEEEEDANAEAAATSTADKSEYIGFSLEKIAEVFPSDHPASNPDKAGTLHVDQDLFAK